MPWFVLKPGRRDRKAAEMLLQCGIETYLPMRQVLEERGGQKRLVERPLIGNMLFARGEHRDVDAVVKREDYLHFAFRKEGRGYAIMEVPDDEMERFRKATEAMAVDVRYFPPDSLYIKAGTRVRLRGGALDGMEATLLENKAEGCSELVVDFSLLGALCTRIIPDFVQILEE